MNQAASDKPILLRYKTQIVALSTIALVFKVLSSISFLVTYEGNWKDGYEPFIKLTNYKRFKL